MRGLTVFPPLSLTAAVTAVSGTAELTTAETYKSSQVSQADVYDIVTWLAGQRLLQQM